MTKETDAQFDNRSMTNDDILERDIRFVSMIIGYKVYQCSKLNSVSGIAIYAVYQMVKEDMQYDLCSFLLEDLLRNLKKIKSNKKKMGFTREVVKQEREKHAQMADEEESKKPKVESVPSKAKPKETKSAPTSVAGMSGKISVLNTRERTNLETNFCLARYCSCYCLVDMYAKCGSIDKARKLFDRIPHRNAFLWTAMIAGYAHNGFAEKALETFKQMQLDGIKPDTTTFASILPACAKMGALVWVVVVWMYFLGACKSHMNIGLGVFTALLILDLDPNNATTYVLLSNIYAEVGRWGEVETVRRLMKDRGVTKIPGCSWIEGHKMVHAFCVGDRSHPQTREICAELEKLALEMKAAGYFPDSRHLSNDVEEEEKEFFLSRHSEKLAIDFGLLNTPPGTTIRVVKNLRVCSDCHAATKFISKIVAREIVVRDANRFHQWRLLVMLIWSNLKNRLAPCAVSDLQ
ncbi:pentatricopeptide repeat-containing protein At1g08070, chloroplastic-like [Cryptomeria japonica]|uniref:pentatricopeptide repeat-containing protein At1g08070, chloroplastic-like n=1 Tax=Cryptomeria japonica TaxID=3369 RepID=UPI0027DA5545|nr:pentatricopeptide repeat-containing protein At1g08070, chloroplastic-like [Cryptomeria japonica]